MAYGAPVKTIQSVAVGVSSLDDRPYWLKVRASIKVKEWGTFMAVNEPIVKWTADQQRGEVREMPPEVVQAYAGLIVDWNFDDEDGAKWPIDADHIGEMELGDLIEVAGILQGVSGGMTREERRDFFSDSTPGSRDSTEPTPPAASNGSAMSSDSIATSV